MLLITQYSIAEGDVRLLYVQEWFLGLYSLDSWYRAAVGEKDALYKAYIFSLDISEFFPSFDMYPNLPI